MDAEPTPYRNGGTMSDNQPAPGTQGKGLIESIGYDLQPDPATALPSGISIASADWAFAYDVRANTLGVVVNLMMSNGNQSPPSSVMIRLGATATPADVDAITVWMSSTKVAMSAATRKSAGGGK
jgi:hypothetical protein